MVKEYVDNIKTLARSATAKDTCTLFLGNIISSFLSFLFTLLVARALRVPDFGIYSAVINLVSILTSLSDLGISSGSVNFIAGAYDRGKKREVNKFIKSFFVIRLICTTVLILITLIFAKVIAVRLLATEDVKMVYWIAILPYTLLVWGLFPKILQSEKRFFQSVLVDISLGLGRLAILLGFILLGGLTLLRVLGSFGLASIFPILAAIIFIGGDFLFVRAEKKYYSKILKFSGWLGVNRVVSSISGRLDIQMLAVMAGSTVVGFYSISSRLAMFILLLSSSFSSVLAPRLASFANKEKEKIYIKKAFLATLPLIMGIISWIIIAKPFITILFGQKYLDSVSIFRVLAVAMIPLLITVPSVTAIIYAIKKPVYIGFFSFFQLVAIFLINLLLIPKVGAFAPPIAFGIVYTILAGYTWVIVIKYYWASSKA